MALGEGPKTSMQRVVALRHYEEPMEGLVDLQMAYPTPQGRTLTTETPGAVRFSDVLAELRAIGRLASQEEGCDGPVSLACRRAETLLERLRGQFLVDVVFSENGPAPMA